MPRIDYSGGADAYRRARTLPPEVLAVWRAAVEAVPRQVCQRVLDVGAGPGGFLEPLQEWFAAPIVAIEPSPAMCADAAGAGLARSFPYCAARCEELPLADNSVDVAWLSTVVHQFDDRDAAVRELRRVLRPGGRVFVRGFFSDVPVTGLFASFPGIARAAATFPSSREVASSFASAGFALASVADVIEPWRFDLTAWTARVRSLRHIDSALRPLTDTEVADGVRIVEEAHRGARGPIASDGTLRLEVYRLGP